MWSEYEIHSLYCKIANGIQLNRVLEAVTHGSSIKAIELCIDLSQCCWRQAVEAHVFFLKYVLFPATETLCVGGDTVYYWVAGLVRALLCTWTVCYIS